MKLPYWFLHPLGYWRAVRLVPCRCERCLRQRKFLPEVPPCETCPTHWAVDGVMDDVYGEAYMVCFVCREEGRKRAQGSVA